MMGGVDHDVGLAARGATIVRNAERLTKDRAKALVAAGIQRNAPSHGAIERLALAGGCSARCIEKALAHDTLPGVDILLNMLDAAPTVLDEVLAARGVRLISLHADPAGDLATMAGLCDAAGALGHALADGVRDHRETLTIADKVRPILPRLEAIVREADAIRDRR